MNGITGDENWREQALAAIGEGFCPNGHGSLRRDAGGRAFTSFHSSVVTEFASGGWCFPCRIWWRTALEEDGLLVVANYALADYPTSGM
jgi:hypothetical protein